MRVNMPASGSLSSFSSRNVLVVDDEASMRMALEMSYGQRGWQVEAASGKTEALDRFRGGRHPLVVSDVRMPNGDGFELMRALRGIAPDTSVILLTAFGAVDDAVVAMKSGASEYLTKPIAFAQLLDLSEQLVSRKQTRAKTLVSSHAAMVGSSAALVRAVAQAKQAAASDADILIEAESGTGKELLARMVHAASARSEHPFVAVNCAALPESLLESELFGHARGAFTGAITAQPGKFEVANGGTLLLDEVGEMPLSLQPKLLRVLQEREFYRVGDTRPVKVDVRVIATTNRKLAVMVNEGTFRADLYYRLNVIPLSLPPLRERREDIRQLAQHFARMFSTSQSAQDLPETLLAQLEQHSWPGNIRELANLIRRRIALQGLDDEFDPECRSDRSGGGEFQKGELIHAFQPTLPRSAATLTPANALSPGMSMQTAEKRLLEVTLDATRGNRSRAAEMLGISLRTVRNKIREYQLPPRRDYGCLHD